MAHRKDYYFKQQVTESELDAGFAGLEDAERAIMLDQALIGIFSGAAVSQHAGVPDLTVDMGAPGVGYDNDGQRIFVSGSTPININCAQDSSSVSTTVAGGGNEKWVSITLKFARALSDPRVDGNSNTVYFDVAESYSIVVAQGGEAALGTASKPPLDPDGLLVVDVHRTFGQTQILNADLSTTRRQDTFVLAGTPVSLRAGTLYGAVLAMLTALNNHILGTGGTHPATAISYAGGPNWADASTNPASDVETQLDKIVNDLGQGTAGTAKISGAASAGTRFSLSAGTLRSQLVAVQGAIDTIETSGADTIKQVSSIANLRAIASANRPASMAVVVLDHGIFCYDSTKLGLDDGRFIIRPNDVAANAAGRFVSLSFKAHLQQLIRSAMFWSPTNTGVSGPLHRATWDAYRGLWWAVAEGGTDILKYSADNGQNWFSQTITGGGGLGTYWIDIDSTGNLVIGNDSSTHIYTYTLLSNTWANLTSLSGGVHKPHVFYDATANLWFIYYYDSVGAKYRVYTSPDRATWTDDTASLPASFVSPAAVLPHAGHGNGVAVVAGPTPGGVVKLAWRTLTGSGWTEVSLASALTITDISEPIYSSADGAWMLAVYGTVSGRNATEIWVSTNDAATWTKITTLSNTNPSFTTYNQGPQFVSIAHAGGHLWVGMGLDGELAYSTDVGTTWYPAGNAVLVNETPLTLNGGNGGFIVFSTNGHLQTSERGEAFAPVALT